MLDENISVTEQKSCNSKIVANVLSIKTDLIYIITVTIILSSGTIILGTTLHFKLVFVKGLRVANMENVLPLSREVSLMKYTTISQQKRG